MPHAEQGRLDGEGAAVLAVGRRVLRSRQGQASVEYALVVAASMAMVVCFAAFLNFVTDGRAAAMVVDALTHRLPAGVLDVLAF